eukprot:c21760_g3_i2 orf=436-801(+)
MLHWHISVFELRHIRSMEVSLHSRALGITNACSAYRCQCITSGECDLGCIKTPANDVSDVHGLAFSSIGSHQVDLAFSISVTSSSYLAPLTSEIKLLPLKILKVGRMPIPSLLKIVLFSAL